LTAHIRYDAFMEAAIMNLSETWQTWLRAVTSPNEPVFEEERQKPQATLSTALIWMALVGAIVAVLSLIQSVITAGTLQSTITQALAMYDLPPELRTQLEQMLNSGLLGGLGGLGLGAIITVPIGFLISTGIYFLIAKLFGGKGEFGRYAYLMATFSAPLTLLSSLLGLIPALGGCLAIFVSIYQVVLTYYATKVEHQLSSGRALLVVLLPLIAFLVFFACMITLLVGLLMAVPVQAN
jgi:hypothetical protein